MTGNKAFRTSVVRSAAVAILESFQALDVHWAIYGDLAWHLLCGSATGGSWRLDVHVMGDTATLAYATGRLASTDPRFSLTKQAFNSKAAMAYTHDVLNDGSPTKKHECRVNFVCSHLRDLFIVKDLPLLPIQLILYRHMEAHFQRSEKRLKKAMDKVIVISEAYLRLPNLPPSVWSLTPAERPLFLDYLAKIMSALPDTADLLARLHPVPLPVATMSPAPPPIVSAAESDSTSVVEISSSSVQERKQLFHSETVLAATRTVSSCIRQQGHDCFLAGPGYVPWYIMGSPIVPKNDRIDFLVILRDDNSLGSLQRILCRQGVLKARQGAFQHYVVCSDGKSRFCKVTLEEVPSSMGLRPDESIGTYFNEFSIVNQSYLFSTMLTYVISRGFPMKKTTYNNVVEALKLLHHRNADVRAAFEDVAELDQLAFTCVAAHPELRTYFDTIGFQSAIMPTLPASLPEVDVQTACDSTPSAQIPVISEKGGLVFQAAADATRLLRDSGYSCAIFGSAACYLYGNRRLPNDVDILVSSSVEAEVAKRYLVDQDPLHFYLRRAKTPGATYQVLWYRQRLDIGEKVVTKRTKVDIVMAGTMMLPFLSTRSIIVKEALTLVPLEVLLLHKLQGWHDHMTAPEPHKQKKQTVDVGDVRRTLKIVLRSVSGTERSWARVALSFFQEEFQRLTMDRVKLFCSAFADCRDDWYRLGFEVA